MSVGICACKFVSHVQEAGTASSSSASAAEGAESSGQPKLADFPDFQVADLPGGISRDKVLVSFKEFPGCT